MKKDIAMTEKDYIKHLREVALKIFGKPTEQPKSRNDFLKLCKQFLKLKEQRIKQRHRAGYSGIEICRMKSDVIDLLIHYIWQECMLQLPPKERSAIPFSITSHGGYGRRVMSPGSDVDITFLFPSQHLQIEDNHRKIISDFLLYLYDLKFKVGHGTRSVEECYALANKNIETKTAIMELRYLIGNRLAFDQFQAGFRKNCVIGQEDSFIEQRLENLKDTHHKYGGTPFVQEPHIKAGCGGLRDYQNLIWMTYIKLGTTNPKDLVSKGLISTTGWKQIENAYAFILTTRNEMHYVEKRAQDLLTLRLQGNVATNLGYRHKKILRRIEAFMKDYYIATRDILQRSSEIMDRFHLQTLESYSKPKGLLSFMVRRQKKSNKIIKFGDFYEQNQRIFLEDQKLFQTNSLMLMEVFRHTQQRHLRMSPELLTAFQAAYKHINIGFRYNKEVREVFLSILSQKGDVARILRQMHRADFLGKYLPEFGALTCLVQHEFFHRYTADEHTLRTIDMLDELSGEIQPEKEFFQKLFHELNQPEILYLALLLHDAGRSANAKAHDEESTIMADAVAKRFQLKGSKRQLLLFLVDNHLLMYRTATTLNLDDSEVIAEFANVVKTKENLDTLMLLTYADSKGTSEASWSGYKELSVRRLYQYTEQYFNAPKDFMKRASVNLEELQEQVQDLFDSSYTDEINAHFQHMPRSYFNFKEPNLIAEHIHHFCDYRDKISKETDSAKAQLPVFSWYDHPSLGYTKITLAGVDRKLLLARVSGALAACNLNILSADFYQRSDNLILDMLRVCNTNFTAITNNSTKTKVQKTIQEAFLSESFDFADIIQKNRQAIQFNDEIYAEIPQRIIVTNDISIEHTVIELQVIDRLGLLYDIFYAVGKLGHNITHARISTEKGVAIDSIYIQNHQNEKISDSEQLEKLKTKVTQAVFANNQGEIAF